MAAEPAGCCLQDEAGGAGRGGSALITKTCAGAELWFARCSAPGPMRQTSATECFRSEAEVLFAGLRSFRFRSRSFCCPRFRSTAAGFFCRYCFQYSGLRARHFRGLSRQPSRYSGRRQVCPGDSRCAALADTPLRRKRSGGPGTSRAGNSFDSSCNAVHPYNRRCLT